MHPFLRIVNAAALATLCLAAADVRSTTIEVSFVATPQDGAAGGAVTAGDLKLTDNGKDQPVTGLWKVMAGKAASLLPPHTFSNRAGGETAQNVNVVFVDGVNTEWRNDAAARAETMRALQQIKPDERVAILVFGKSLRVLSDFTDTAAAREAKVKEFGAGSPSAFPTYSDMVLPVNLSAPHKHKLLEHEEVTANEVTVTRFFQRGLSCMGDFNRDTVTPVSISRVE